MTETELREQLDGMSKDVITEEYVALALAYDQQHRDVHVLIQSLNDCFLVIANVTQDSWGVASELRKVKKKKSRKTLKRVSKALVGLGDTLDLFVSVKSIELMDFTKGHNG
jgi:hypothetical protein